MNRTGQPWLVAGHSVSNELVIHPSKRDSIRHDANVTDDQPITFTNDIVFFFSMYPGLYQMRSVPGTISVSSAGTIVKQFMT